MTTLVWKILQQRMQYDNYLDIGERNCKIKHQLWRLTKSCWFFLILSLSNKNIIMNQDRNFFYYAFYKIPKANNNSGSNFTILINFPIYQVQPMLIWKTLVEQNMVFFFVCTIDCKYAIG